MEIQSILQRQKLFFDTGKTKDLDYRINQLSQLKNSIIKYEEEILAALEKDLGKPAFEGYATEIGFLLNSINHVMKNLKKWAKKKRIKTPIHQLNSKSFIKMEPYGIVLIIGPFNYPFQLTMEPMIGGMAAGNTVILKPSEHTPNTEKVIEKIIEETFDPQYIALFTGGKEITTKLINSSVDYIFFTGSVPVGKVVMEAAAKNLVPVTLELGGKSPVIVDKTANMDRAAKRIIWGKFLNVGQTCVAPDYIYVHDEVKNNLIEALKRTINSFYGNNPKESGDYGKVIHERALNRLVNLMDKNKVIFGGDYDRESLYMAPTIMTNVTWEDQVMSEEIFGPILPILSYNCLDQVIKEINGRPKPLALYLFTEDQDIENKIIEEISYGSGAINDTISQVASHYMPFGGVGSSGMGAYHGKYSFETFSHAKGILKKSTKFDFKLIYPPYKDKINLLRKILK